MAENKKNRKSQRKFSLEKTVERHFEIEKDVEISSEETIVKKGTFATGEATNKEQNSQGDKLNKNTNDNQQQSGKNGVLPNDDGVEKNDGTSNSKKWIIIVIIFVVIVVIAYFLKGCSKNGDAKDPLIPQVEQNDSTQNNVNANDTTGIYGTETEDVSSSDSQDANRNDKDSDVAEKSEEAVKSQQNQMATKEAAENRTETNQESVSTQTPNDVSTPSAIEQKARDVWRGIYGNNPDRRRNLGSDYEAVQKLVNEMYKTSKVH